ncbi:MAG: hypothetical protein WCA13_07260 [Terriglobales bacterium]
MAVTSAGYEQQVTSKEDLDELCLVYKKAVDEWVDTIRAEEALATPRFIQWSPWNTGNAHAKVTEAREAYKDALRSVNCSI